METVAGSNGAWAVRLQTLVANTEGATYTLTVEGKNVITLENVAIGEVWIISGQSNANVTMTGNVEGGVVAAQHARYQQIRLMRIGDRPSAKPEDDYQPHGSFPEWQTGTSTWVRSFSAVGFFFARDLHESTGVPVGVIQSAKAGSLARAWVPTEELEELEEFAGKGPWQPGNPEEPRLTPAAYYNGGIAPLRQFTIRGVLFYQGETNVDIDDPEIYSKTLPKVVEGWRRAWGQGDFPFYFVHIVPWPDYLNDSYPEVLEVQSSMLSLPNTGIAVTVDLADPDLHPPRKREVGERLSLLARAHVHREDVEFSGPVYQGKVVQNGDLRLYFSHADGLTLNAEAAAFEIAGKDLQFHPASATVEGSSVVLNSPEAPQPLHARFAWNTYPQAALYNSAGLPAAPFRTDIPSYVPSIFGYIPANWGWLEIIGEDYIYLDSLGWTFVGQAPWIYSGDHGRWFYVPEPAPEDAGLWMHVPISLKSES